ncbi:MULTISPECIES: hypothetical protein [Streptomyces]|uniref:Uncharacterized protein n=1 Tax=Streptomyces fimbriatus TaxID=68197 RepID=A0ABW0DIR1_STRFI
MKQLKLSCWILAAFAILEPIVFVTVLTERHPSVWTLTWTGFGTIFFPCMLFMTMRQLRAKKRATEEA